MNGCGMVHVVGQVSDKRLQGVGILSSAQLFERMRGRDRLDHVPVYIMRLSAPVSFFRLECRRRRQATLTVPIWRLPRQNAQTRISQATQLGGSRPFRGRGHTIQHIGRYKGAGVHLACSSEKLETKEAGWRLTASEAPKRRLTRLFTD